MPSMGKHRRSRASSLTRGLIAVSTGGAVLALPVLGATTASAAPAQPVSVEKSVAPTAVSAKAIAAKKAKHITYTVIPGDYLSKIAHAHSVSGGWQTLYQDNRQAVGDNPDLIHPGLKLTIHLHPRAKSDAASKAAPAEKAVPEPGTSPTVPLFSAPE